MTTGESLDHSPLQFGKYAGKTPDEVSQIDGAYIVWMYENVKNFPTCSKLLYEACQADAFDGESGDSDDSVWPRQEF